jgi:hypothetical protein
MAAAPGNWQLAQEIFDVNSNLLFRAYDHLEQVFNATNVALLATANLESNSVFIFDNNVNRNRIVASWDGRVHRYKIFQPGDDTAWLRAVETPPISDQLQAMVSQAQSALPGILALTNKISTVLDNAVVATSNLNITLVTVRPLVTNFAVISAQLREPGGPMVWALGPNGNHQVQDALTNVNSLLVNTDTNLATILIQLADITGSLNAQVQANTNMLGGISKAVTDADDLVQGLKRHWLLRSAFKTKDTNAPSTTVQSLLPPRMR